MNTERTKIHADIRWMIRRDVSEVLEVDDESYYDAMTETELIRHLRHRRTIGMVAELADEIVGYVIYELYPRSIDVIRLGIAERYRRRGIGTLLIDKLKTKLNSNRKKVRLMVVDSGTKAHLFLRANGFLAIRIVRAAHDDDIDEYDFEYQA